MRRVHTTAIESPFLVWSPLCEFAQFCSFIAGGCADFVTQKMAGNKYCQGESRVLLQIPSLCAVLHHSRSPLLRRPPVVPSPQCQLSIRWIPGAKKCSHPIQHFCHKTITTKLARNQQNTTQGILPSGDAASVQMTGELLSTVKANVRACFQIDASFALLLELQSGQVQS